MRPFALLLVLFATACTARYPVRLRPGSNVALPPSGTESLVEGIVGSLLCEKARANAARPAIAPDCSLDASDPLIPGRPPVIIAVPVIRWP